MEDQLCQMNPSPHIVKQAVNQNATISTFSLNYIVIETEMVLVMPEF